MADRFKEIVTTNGTNATWSITPYTGEAAGTPALRVKDNGEITVTALAGARTRTVVADSTGKLVANSGVTTNITVTDTPVSVGQVTAGDSSDVIITITDTATGHRASFLSMGNYYAGSDIKVSFTGYSAVQISDGNTFSFRLGSSTFIITFPTIGGLITLRRDSPGSTNVNFTMRSLY